MDSCQEARPILPLDWHVRDAAIGMKTKRRSQAIGTSSALAGCWLLQASAVFSTQVLSFIKEVDAEGYGGMEEMYVHKMSLTPVDISYPSLFKVRMNNNVGDYWCIAMFTLRFAVLKII